MQHLFGSFLLERHNARGGGVKHKRVMRRGGEGASGMESRQGPECDECGGICDEADMLQEVDYVPATYLHGKYVLLYLADPTGNGIAVYKQTEDSAASSQTLCTGNRSLSTCASPNMPPVDVSAAGSTLAAGAPASVQNTHLSPTAFTSAGATSQRTRTKLSIFYELLICQLTATLSQERKPVVPIVVLEVRQPGDPEEDPLTSDASTEQQTMAVTTTTTDAVGDAFPPSMDYLTRESDTVIPFLGVSTPNLDALLNRTCNRSPFFGGWFSLESSSAYRQVIQNFDVSSWPSVLLFDPAGRLLTTHALSHIEREMKSDVMQNYHLRPLMNCEAKQQCRDASFHSDFPWCLDETQSDSGTKPECFADMLSVSSFLRRLILHARRIGSILEDDFLFEPEYMPEGEECGTCDACLDGATHVALYFGADWHPSSRQMLPRLHHFWLATNRGNEDDGNDGERNKEGGSWDMGRKTFNMSLSGGDLPLEQQCMLSYQMEGYGDSHRSASLLDSETRGFSSSLSLMTPLQSPKRKKFLCISPHVNLEGKGAPEKASSKQMGGETAHSFSPLDSHLRYQQLPASTPERQSEQRVELEAEEEEGGQPVHLQVLYLSCDTDKSSLYSFLNDMPPSWLCVSSLFGPVYRKMIETCLELFNVSVFPRLVVTAVKRGHDASGPANGSALPKPPSTLTFHVADPRGEEVVLRYNGAKRFPWREQQPVSLPQLPFRCPVAKEFTSLTESCDAIRSLLAEGGCLFLLCGTGKVSPELHKLCATALQEASLWWSQEMCLFARRLEHRLMLSLRESSAPTDHCASEQGPGPHHLTLLSDAYASVTPATTSVESFAVAATDEQVPYLSVYFIDAVVEEAETHNNPAADSQDKTDGDWSCSNRVSGEEKTLLQEYFLSATLEDKQLLPPVEGEPFLLCVHWPERRAAVLRQKFEYENSLLQASAVSLRSSSSSATTPSQPNGCSPSTNAAFVEGRPLGTAALPVTTTEPCSCHSSLSATLRGESSPEQYLSNPLCSLSQVKAFVAQHAFH
ncbi:hypothetical protein TraAM80_04115 [Trypanosoma rangeli]|uniref:Thioredoxin domain-containing protein n=1 Tax=Trypanosoma rangeli TaxID=5698 RepID=A0A422NKU1_TRYRA|nr:uncharacterized protein TraAM80_04115 [Trypanosoma rangeli]RNF06138.1 hypothetical protein TraAM80_04115 [Trypanosoma rangeli]|eukprot:RNF06138.1 hypothetical protein TraAM80_04115 [Trypanosoma rangeli]